VDIAEESTKMAKYNILMQSSTAILAQANQINANVLRLLS
jgi:flagellin-like hook-associated protein FlgL